MVETVPQSAPKSAISRTLVISSVVLVCGLIVLVVVTAVNRLTDSDPMGSLLVSSSILERGTVFLDGYSDMVLSTLSTRVEDVGGSPAYMFPIGTSLLSLPFVALAKLLGFDVLTHDHQIQIAIAVATSVLAYVLMYLLGRRYLSHWPALALAAVFWFGTSLSSTGATALWSHNWGVIGSLLVLLLLTVALRGRRRFALPLIALTLAIALITRPQLALLALLVIVALLVAWPRGGAVVAALLVGLLALLGMVNLALTGQVIPGYYLPQRLEGTDTWVALAGNLVSPARGLLVFTPFLIVLPLLAFGRRRLQKPDWLLLGVAVAWPVLHWIAISRFPHWWGGWSFGPRLMMDVLPGLFLATVILWPTTLKPVTSKIAVALFAALAAVSVAIHTGQGLYNPYSRFWYIEPSVDLQPDMLWDWGYPQFLARESGHEDRMQAHLATPEPLPPGTDVPVESSALGLVGWSTGFASPGISLDSFILGPSALLREDGRRWTEGSSARILINVPTIPPQATEGTVSLAVDVLDRQAVRIDLNGTEIYDGIVGPDRAVITTSIDASRVRPGVNVLNLSLPQATEVGQASDYRAIAIALKKFRLDWSPA